MSKAVVNIVLEDEEEAASSDKQWNPGMIVEQLKQIDPDDLDDVQQRLYDHLWGEGGHFSEQGDNLLPTRRLKISL